MRAFLMRFHHALKDMALTGPGWLSATIFLNCVTTSVTSRASAVLAKLSIDKPSNVQPSPLQAAASSALTSESSLTERIQLANLSLSVSMIWGATT